MNFFRVFAVFFRIGLMNDLAYRANFLVQIADSLLGLAVALGSLSVIFGHTDTVGDWSQNELFVLVGVYFLMSGVIGMLIQPSMRQFMEDVQQGTLDFSLTKPADSQLLVSMREIRIWPAADILTGLGVIAYALVRMRAEIAPAQAAAFALMLAAGATIVYSFFLMLATCSFWIIRANNLLYIFESMYESGARWPVGIYPRWLRLTMTFVVPIAFAVTVPAEAVVGRYSWGTIAGALGIAAFLLIVSRLFWKVGLRRYSGASA
jgi:ABC-2 type transport system permease protein